MAAKSSSRFELPPEVVDHLRAAESVLAITGAGISAESGLPTYRGIGGLYEDADTEEGMSIEEALSGETFRADPALTWKHIARIERACRGASPSEAHAALAWMEDHYPRFWVLTQNVDGLHTRAGTRNLIEIHGNVHRLVCTGCGKRTVVESYVGLELPPRCADCGAIVRPDVVLFGEMLPVIELAKLERELARGFDLVLSVGTTSVFPYIAGPVVSAHRRGKPTIEINPGTTEVSRVVSHRIPHGAAVALTAMQRALGG